MNETHASVPGNILSFTPRPLMNHRLTPQDIADIARWQAGTDKGGYDRITVAQAEAADAPEDGEFVMLGREGELWSRWGFARKGPRILAWCCLTGTDVGEFASLAAAFHAVIPGPMRPAQAQRDLNTGSVVRMVRPGHAANTLTTLNVQRG